MSFWTFKTPRYLVLYSERELGNCASIFSREDGRILGSATDSVGLKTRQQLVREACDAATDKILRDFLTPLGRKR